MTEFFELKCIYPKIKFVLRQILPHLDMWIRKTNLILDYIYFNSMTALRFTVILNDLKF